jgi:hypothetical protein
MIEDLFGGAIARALERVKTGVTKARQQLTQQYTITLNPSTMK